MQPFCNIMWIFEKENKSTKIILVIAVNILIYFDLWYQWNIMIARRLFFMKHFFIINFQKEKANTFTLLIILIVKSLQIELHSTNLLLKVS